MAHFLNTNPLPLRGRKCEYIYMMLFVVFVFVGKPINFVFVPKMGREKNGLFRGGQLTLSRAPPFSNGCCLFSRPSVEHIPFPFASASTQLFRTSSSLSRLAGINPHPAFDCIIFGHSALSPSSFFLHHLAQPLINPSDQGNQICGQS